MICKFCLIFKLKSSYNQSYWHSNSIAKNNFRYKTSKKVNENKIFYSFFFFLAEEGFSELNEFPLFSLHFMYSHGQETPNKAFLFPQQVVTSAGML